MKYRGIEIIEYVDGRSGIKKFKARFQLNNQEHTPKKTSLDSLKQEINKIFVAADQGISPKQVADQPFVDDILKRELSTIKDHKKYTFYERVYTAFLSLIPPLKLDELTQADFNAYAEMRRSSVNPRTNEPVKNATINKELSALSVALNKAPKVFRVLDKAKPIRIEKLSNDYKPRKRVVKEFEFEALFSELRKPRQSQEREYDHFYRFRLADWLEFEALTGLRRKEISLLKPEHYDPKTKALVNWTRPKTDSDVVFFPLRQRAAEIVEERIACKTEYLFSNDGSPIESQYRKLKNVCESLNIKYGSFKEGGFVMHDLRRNFGTEVVKHTDIKTASEMLGHADLTHTKIYLATDKERMIEAVRKMDGVGIEDELRQVLTKVGTGESTIENGVETLLKLWLGR